MMKNLIGKHVTIRHLCGPWDDPCMGPDYCFFDGDLTYFKVVGFEAPMIGLGRQDGTTLWINISLFSKIEEFTP